MAFYSSVLKILWIECELWKYWLILEFSARFLKLLQHAGNIKIGQRFTTSWKIFIQRLKFDIYKLWKSRSHVYLNVVPLLIVFPFIVWSVEDYIEPNSPISHLIHAFLVSLLWYVRPDDREMGVALAWSFYFGYLQIMLPKLVQSQQVWVDEHGEEQDIVGWFILIPSDCITPGAIKDKNDRIHMKENSEPIKVNTAGIKNRVFKNTVYKVESQSKDCNFYCYLEYATPVKHFYTMTQGKYAEQMSFGLAEMSYQNDLFESTIREILDCYEEEMLTKSKGKLKDFIQIVRVEGDGKNIADAVVEARWRMRGHSDKKKKERGNEVTTEPTEETTIT